MLMKLLGIALVIGGSGAYGLFSANRLQKRVEHIINFRLALGYLEKEINYLLTPLPVALMRSAMNANEPAKSFFKVVSEDLNDRAGITVSEVWQQNLNKMRITSELKNEDIELLGVISSRLGMSGVEEQMKMFAMIQEQLKIQEKKARQEEHTGRKLRVYGGFAFGATVVLMLI